MTTSYSLLDLGEVIKALRELPEGSRVKGIESGVIHSDRGYYDRNAVTPSRETTWEPRILADQLASCIGGVMYGWKGGEYPIRSDKPVAYADDGDTGPYLAGFSEIEPGLYRPVTIDTGWW